MVVSISLIDNRDAQTQTQTQTHRHTPDHSICFISRCLMSWWPLRVWAFTRWQSPCYNIEVTGYAKSASPLPEIRCVHLNLPNPCKDRSSSSGLPYPYSDPSGAVPRRVGFLEPKPFIGGGHRSEEVTIYPPYCHNHVKWSSFKYLSMHTSRKIT